MFLLPMFLMRFAVDINSVSFLAIIAPSTGAIKCSGNSNGGTLLLAVDDTQLPQLLKTALLREQLLRVTIQVADE